MNINEIVQESPHIIENKMVEMQKEIEDLKIQLESKQALLDEFKEQTGEFTSVGHLKAHMEDLQEQVQEKTREILELNQEVQTL